MRKIKSEGEFERIWNESEALVCDFSATWCGPCKMLEPILKKLEKDFPEAVFAKVDIDEFEELSEEKDVQAVPTLFFVSKGKITKTLVGVESHATLAKQTRKLLESNDSR